MIITSSVYCYRCGRCCDCSTVTFSNEMDFATSEPQFSLPPVVFEADVWFWEAAHGPDPVPGAPADQGVPMQRWREYQRRR